MTEQQEFIAWLKEHKLYNPIESAETMQSMYAVWKEQQKEIESLKEESLSLQKMGRISN